MAIKKILLLLQIVASAGEYCFLKYYSYTYRTSYYRYKTCYYGCCYTGCCYYSPGGLAVGAIIGIVAGLGTLIAIAIAIICICRRRQMFAGRVMTPAVNPVMAPVTVVQTGQQGTAVQYQQYPQMQMNPVMSPPPYSPPQAM